MALKMATCVACLSPAGPIMAMYIQLIGRMAALPKGGAWAGAVGVHIRLLHVSINLPFIL